MKMMDTVLDALEDLKICNSLTDIKLNDILGDWISYSRLLSDISTELKILAKLDEVITPLERVEDQFSFFMEISCLLTELGCPYSIICEGELTSRFDSNDKRLLLLNFLLGELQASQMQLAFSPKTTDTHMEITLEESEQAKLLREILQSLEFSKPPDGIDISTLCRKIQERICPIQDKFKAGGVETEPLFKGVLTDNQWRQIEKFNKELYAEYKLRREMLLKRLDVTIQSFQWSSNKSDKQKDRNETISNIFKESRGRLNPKPQVRVSNVLAARADLVYFEKTSSGSLRENTKSAVNKVMIGRVPDRGGRPSEAQPPPPEMPPWQQRQGGSSGGSSGSIGWTQRGGRGGRRGQESRGNQGGNRGGYREAQGGGDYRGGPGNDMNQQHDPFDYRGGRGGNFRRGSQGQGQPPRVQSGWYSRN